MLALSMLLTAAGGATFLASVGGRRDRWRRRLLGLDALLFALCAVVLVAYVASEDDDRADGVTRWAAYDAQALTVVAVATSLAVAVLALVALRRAEESAPFVGAAGVGASLVYAAAILQNSTS